MYVCFAAVFTYLINLPGGTIPSLFLFQCGMLMASPTVQLTAANVVVIVVESYYEPYVFSKNVIS